MSKKEMQPTITEHGVIATILGKETAFSGTLAFKKPLQISGDFTGEIISDGYLVISEGARVKANIKLSTGKVQGNIRTAKLQIADGVVFDGNCEMLSSDEP
jgi:cytoskeletal protein CcmA (bactofilin family)